MTLLGRIGRSLTTTTATRVLVTALVAAATLVTGATAGAARAETGAGTITCGYTFAKWPGAFMADVRLTNHGPDIDGWYMELTFSIPTTLGSAWSAKMSQPDPYTMVAENLSYNRVIPSGGSVIAGWIAFSSSHQLPDLRVNGVPCEITVLAG